MGDEQGAFDESQRGLAVNPEYPQCYLSGAAAAQHLGAHEQAQEWLQVLCEQTAFNSVAGVRLRMGRTYGPARPRTSSG
jgi:uncharacterized protein HemY